MPVTSRDFNEIHKLAGTVKGICFKGIRNSFVAKFTV